MARSASTVKPLDKARTADAALTLIRLFRSMERVDAGLTPQQYRVLKLIGAGGERSAKLAERLAVAKPTLTSTADALVAAGFLQRETEMKDRRVVRLVPDRGRPGSRGPRRRRVRRLARRTARPRPAILSGCWPTSPNSITPWTRCSGPGARPRPPQPRSKETNEISRPAPALAASANTGSQVCGRQSADLAATAHRILLATPPQPDPCPGWLPVRDADRGDHPADPARHRQQRHPDQAPADLDRRHRAAGRGGAQLRRRLHPALLRQQGFPGCPARHPHRDVLRPVRARRRPSGPAAHRPGRQPVDLRREHGPGPARPHSPAARQRAAVFPVAGRHGRSCRRC